MASRLTMLAPRLIALIVIWLLAAASWTLAAGGPETPQPATPAASEPTTPEVLVVPDVRRQAYVFSKGILQDAGFAWRVEGPVGGYAANTVLSQVPAAGVRVVDNGAPTVVLRLKRSGEYDERGVPENHSSYKGTAVVLLSNWQAAQKEKAAAPTETQPVATTTSAAPPAAPPRLPSRTRRASRTASLTSWWRAHRASPPTRCGFPNARSLSRSGPPRSPGPVGSS